MVRVVEREGAAASAAAASKGGVKLRRAAGNPDGKGERREERRPNCGASVRLRRGVVEAPEGTR